MIYTNVTFMTASSMAAGILIHQGDTPEQLQPENFSVGAIWRSRYYMLTLSIERDIVIYLLEWNVIPIGL